MVLAFSTRSAWTGMLLAGGRSERMGRDKAFLPSSGMESPNLFTAALLQMERCCAEVLVLGASKLPDVCSTQTRFLADAAPHAGPLSALVHALPELRSAWVLVLPLDMPALPDALLDLGMQRATEDPSPGFFAQDSDARACFPLWLSRTGLLALLQQQQAGTRSLFTALRQVGLLPWTPPEDLEVPGGDPLRNLNTPTDLTAWRQSLSKNPTEA